MRRIRLLLLLLPLLTLTACAPPIGSAGSSAETRTSTSTPTSSASGTGSADALAVEGSVLRFRSARTTVDVTIGADNPTVRDLVSKLPLRLTAEEFSGREKIADIPGGLATSGSPGSDPEDGDLIYYVPWGNLGFYYDASGVGFSGQTIHIGTYRASRGQLDDLEGSVTVTLVRS